MGVGNKRVKDYPDHVRKVRSILKPFIEKLLEDNPLTSQQIIEEVKKKFSKNCDDSVICTCSGGKHQSEWIHQTRWGLYDLKSSSKIQYEKQKKLYAKQTEN
jgi:hypothetical protein